MSYYITFDSSGGLTLAHGVEWRRHKYIRKEGNRYIYPEDLKEKALNNVAREQRKGMARTKSYTERGVAAAHPEIPENIRKEIVNANPYDTYYKERGRLEETNPAKGHAMDAADKAQWDGKKRTRQIWLEGRKYQGADYGRGSNERGAAARREFEAERASDRIARQNEQRRVDADWAAYEAQRRGERQTKLEDRRALERGAAKGRKLMEIEKRGQQQTRDFYERENIYGPRYYNVSKDTPGAIKNSHGSFGTTEQFKLESAKEHRERLSEEVKDRKNKVLFSRAVNSVERFGAKTVKSIADSAKKGANWVSNLFKKKK